LKFGLGNEAGLIGLTNVQVTLTMNALSQMWSHSPTATNTLATVVGSFSANPTLLQTYITPQLVPAVPAQIMYPYFKTEYVVTQGSAVTAGSSTSLASTNIVWPTIPKVAYLYVRQRTATRDFTSSDSFAVINSVSIQFNNMPGILASASQQDLYTIAVSNGCQLSWPEWTLYRGSVLPIVFGKDIGLDAIESAGLAGNYQFQVLINYTNSSAVTTTFDLYIVYIQEGLLSISQGNVLPVIGVISPKDILDSKDSPFMEYRDAASYWGGDFFGSLKNYLGRAVQAAQSAVPYIEKALPYVTKYAPHALKLLGVGAGKNKKRKSSEMRGGDIDDLATQGSLGPRSTMSLSSELEREYSKAADSLSGDTVTMSRSEMLSR